MKKRTNEEFLEYVLDQLGRQKGVSTRAMFGAQALYIDTVIFAIVHGGRFFLKADDNIRRAFREAGSDSFQPKTGQRMESYYEVPLDVLEDAPDLKRWSARSIQVARAEKPPGRPRPSAGKKSR